MQILWWGLIFIISFLHLTDVRMSDQELLKKFSVDNQPVHVKYYRHGNYNIRYVETGQEDGPTVIFVHGAPGSLDAFTGFLNDTTLRKKFHLISVDRPGYGNSGYGKSLTSIREQALSLLPLLDLNKSVYKPLLVGHSYGGPIIAEMAMLAPDKIGALQLVGAAVDPDHEKIFWINYLLKLPPVRWLMPGSVNVANDEKITHIAELKKMLNSWDKIDVPVTIIHGTSDSLVPIQNAWFAEKKLDRSRVTMRIYNKKGHLIPFLNPEYMKKEIREYPGAGLHIAGK